MYFTVVIKDGFSFSENQSFYIITDSFNNKSFAFKKEFFFQVFNETSSIQFVCSKRSFLTKFKSLQSKIISFISNKVFSEKFSIVGVGYKCSLISQNTFQINIGLSHPVLFTIPKGIVVEISKDQTKAFFYSINYSLLKEFVSFICQQKQTDPYKGKGCFIISKVSVLPLKEGKRSK
uniref:Ribosomal protein L6 n=1 Tax=Schizochytrium sp. TIO1101 TaxID=1868228 RepID=A0A2Z1TL32_9STRA|nr:ribosomal protein L6 [Schizochytrium sp. TIO1101]